MQAVNAGVHRTYSMFVEILEKSPNFEDRGGECSPPLILYMEKENAKKEVLDGYGRTFLFMMVSFLPVSLIRRNNQGIIHNIAQIFLSQNGRLISV